MLLGGKVQAHGRQRSRMLLAVSLKRFVGMSTRSLPRERVLAGETLQISAAGKHWVRLGTAPATKCTLQDCMQILSKATARFRVGSKGCRFGAAGSALLLRRR